ncbi:MAG: substrate-binding domain-containing protein [Spirochaetales bacterium]|nr:substrate-binding domain-containing protein [Spirochaetales bacterium]
MGKYLKFLTLFLGLVFIGFFIVSVRLLILNPLLLSADQPGDPSRAKSFHYAFFMPSSDYSFFNSLKAGALDASDAMDCAVNFNSINEDMLSFEMASFSGIDGIAVFVYDNSPAVLSELEEISRLGIPIVQIENEAIIGSNAFFIGTNSFDSGKSIGRIALFAEKNAVHIALIYSEKNPGLMSDANLVEIGLKTTMGDRLRELSTGRTSLNPIDAERVVYDLLLRNPDTDIIVLSDMNDTLVAIQAIIDLNLVGQIQIIGFGEDETIREYIRKGVVLGSIVRNPYRIGYSAVMALKEISTIGYTSAYIDTGINILTRAEVERVHNGSLR